jgi:hypothetical protein
MFNRRSLLLSLLAAPLPLAAAVAQPWWDERARRAEWERYQEEERRRREARHEAWDERREHEAWERRRREEAQRDWEREHGPYRR